MNGGDADKPQVLVMASNTDGRFLREPESWSCMMVPL
jgi:hypothetical protein